MAGRNPHERPFCKKTCPFGGPLFTAGLFLVFLLFFLWKYQRGFYTDPVLDLRINEICTLNTYFPDTAAEGGAAYGDYIELYNSGTKTVS